MNAQGTERTEKRLCVGLLAHVDAGKTTLSEAMLYRAGVIRTLGRVDHGDTFLDTDAQERSRGITIFSKQAVLPLPGVRPNALCGSRRAPPRQNRSAAAQMRGSRPGSRKIRRGR